MPFSVLIVVERFVYGGVETSIANEVTQLSQQGVDVHLAVGSEWKSAIIPGNLVSITTDLDFSSSCTASSFLKSVDILRNIIQKNKIDIVHVHPFSSILAGFTAAELEEIPCVHTVHGPATLATYFGPFYNFLYMIIILPSLPLIYCVSEETFDIVENFVNSEKIKILANSIEINNTNDDILDISEGQKDYWLVVSRLDESKINGILDAIRKISSCNDYPIWIAGEGPAQNKLKQQLQELGLEARITFLGSRKDIKELMHNALAIVGMGRVVLEGISCKKPVLLTGYDGVKGFVTPDLLKQAAIANFSGRNLSTVDTPDLQKNWGVTSASVLNELHDIIEEDFSSEKTWKIVGQDFKSLEYKDHFSLMACFYNELKREAQVNSKQLLLSAEYFDLLDRYIFSKKFYQQQIATAYTYYRKVYADNLIIELKKINYVHEYKAILQNKENENLKTKMAKNHELFLKLREKISTNAARTKDLQLQSKQRSELIAQLQANNKDDAKKIMSLKLQVDENNKKIAALELQVDKDNKEIVDLREQVDSERQNCIELEQRSVFNKIKSLLKK